MSEFVNYGSRSVDLPAGCKDLVDILNRKDVPLNPNRSQSIRSARGRLSDLERLIREFLRNQGTALVGIMPSDSDVALTLAYRKNVPTVIVCLDSSDAKREEVVRRLFREAAIISVSDSIVPSPGGMRRVINYPSPQVVRDAVGLIAELLRQAYQVSPESGLAFVWNW